ncbi:MAG TPA: hypothetical protein VGI96_37105 [Streptosporangiaceae bacterium]|jgi:hypothetical protein
MMATGLTNATEPETLYRQVFNEVFGTLTGVTMPAPPRRAPDPGQHADRYERVSRRLDVPVHGSQLRTPRVPISCCARATSPGHR